MLLKNSFASSRAGIIPIFENKGLFMISSNADFGGPDPAIAKGTIDKGETSPQAAIREGEEELGLRISNMIGKPKLGWSGKIKGLSDEYLMDVYYVQVKDPKAFDIPHYETKETVWLSLKEFENVGRQSHLHIIRRILK